MYNEMHVKNIVLDHNMRGYGLQKCTATMYSYDSRNYNRPPTLGPMHVTSADH